MKLLAPEPYVICASCRNLLFIDSTSSAGLIGQHPAPDVVNCCACRSSHIYQPAQVLPVIAPRIVSGRDTWRDLHTRHSCRYSVYLMINTVRGMLYIGRTNGHLSDRMSLHRSSSRKPPYKTPIQRALAEFGHERFSMILLEEAISSPNEDRERYYIDRLDTCNPAKGYNRTGCRTLEQVAAYGQYCRNFAQYPISFVDKRNSLGRCSVD